MSVSSSLRLQEPIVADSFRITPLWRTKDVGKEMREIASLMVVVGRTGMRKMQRPGRKKRRLSGEFIDALRKSVRLDGWYLDREW
jgi:hypothetical protein